jgi:hypothetical protein
LKIKVPVPALRSTSSLSAGLNPIEHRVLFYPSFSDSHRTSLRSHMVLILNVPGASPEQLARGLEAAQAVLDAAGVTLAQAAEGRWVFQHWKLAGGQPKAPTDDEMEAAAALRVAERAALEACFDGRPTSDGGRLDIADA